MILQRSVPCRSIDSVCNMKSTTFLKALRAPLVCHLTSNLWISLFFWVYTTWHHITKIYLKTRDPLKYCFCSGSKQMVAYEHFLEPFQLSSLEVCVSFFLLTECTCLNSFPLLAEFLFAISTPSSPLRSTVLLNRCQRQHLVSSFVVGQTGSPTRMPDRPVPIYP